MASEGVDSLFLGDGKMPKHDNLKIIEEYVTQMAEKLGPLMR
jgi:hypothetical protein